MDAPPNEQFKLARRPVGLAKRSDWEFVRVPARKPRDGEVLVEVAYLSLDPAMRGWMNEGKSYAPPVQIGEVMRAIGVGRVVASNAAALVPGDAVVGMLNVQRYACIAAGALSKVDTTLAPLPVYLSALGMTGMTAYFGLLDVGRPEAGQTVVVSAAAGAVGAIVGQIAKIKNCRVVGIAGGAPKCRYLTEELGFDAAIDYRDSNVAAGLGEHCPARIDVYFDNVGGDTLDACLAQLAMHARVVICGAISQYNATAAVKGPSNYLSLLVNRARMEGMIVFDYTSRFPEAIREMSGWLTSGRLRSREDIVPGFETFPDTFLKLFTGENFGKLILQVTG